MAIRNDRNGRLLPGTRLVWPVLPLTAALAEMLGW
jgi:hypothetical protein